MNKIERWWRGVDWDEVGGWITIIIFIAICILIVYVITDSIGTALEEYRIAKDTCLLNGYPEIEYSNGVYYCVGMREGESVVIRVEELRDHGQ